MSIPKHKDMNWKTYVRALAESASKPSDIERVELAGYLLRRDMDRPGFANIVKDIFSADNYDVIGIVSAFLIAESPDTADDLHRSTRNLVVDYYAKEMEDLIIQEENDMRDFKVRENPNDEYDPNADDAA